MSALWFMEHFGATHIAPEFTLTITTANLNGIRFATAKGILD